MNYKQRDDRSLGEIERTEIADRASDVRRWATSRIAWCERELGRRPAGAHSASSLMAEARALRAVLRMLSGEGPR